MLPTTSNECQQELHTTIANNYNRMHQENATGKTRCDSDCLNKIQHPGKRGLIKPAKKPLGALSQQYDINSMMSETAQFEDLSSYMSLFEEDESGDSMSQTGS